MNLRILILTLLLPQACSFLNPLVTEKAFRDYADQHIGMDIDYLIARLSYSPTTSLSLNNGLTEYRLEHTYQSTQSGKVYSCEWALIANDNSRLVESWRYISEPSQCMHQYFYEGAW